MKSGHASGDVITLEDVEDLARLMVTYQLSKIVVDGMTLERPLHAILPPVDPAAKRDAEEAVDEFDKLKAMSPEAQDAYLSLSPERPR